MYNYIVLGAGMQGLAIAYDLGKFCDAKKIVVAIFIFFFFTDANGQKIEKVYLNKKDSTVSCYTVIHPTKLPVNGFICLLPSFNETAEKVLRQSDLPKVSARNGFLTFIPTLATGTLSFGIDSISQQSLRDIIDDVTSRYELTGKQFFIGGFSIGGSCAIKYAESAMIDNIPIKPTAVFAIDPPLDFERFYNSSLRDVRLSVQARPSQENVYMIDRIEKEMGGTPQTSLSNYHKLSPYSFSDTTQTAIRILRTTPIRIYSEPDVNWWVTNRGADFSSMNVLDASAMINELQRLGNKNAVLVTTHNKGYRKPGNQRHPHSWSIVDNDELVKWLLNQK